MNDEDVLCWEINPREELRLDLVSAACEVVTLAGCVRQAVAQPGTAASERLLGKVESLCARALSVLSPNANFDALGEAVLQKALAILRDDVREMHRVRDASRELACDDTCPAATGSTSRIDFSPE